MLLNDFSRILIVDDSFTARKIIRQMLQRLGYDNIDEATDGQAAMVKLETRSYAMIVSDWAMQPMSGIRLLKTLRRSDTWKTMPFIMVTAMAQNKFETFALDLGATHFLSKPFTFEAFADTVASFRAGGTAVQVPTLQAQPPQA